MKNRKTFTTREVMVPFKCDVHGWMSAYAGVLDHPYFAVTTGGGRFELKNLPPGTYTIEAWHERLGTQTQQVTLGEKETKDVSFTFKPAAAVKSNANAAVLTPARTRTADFVTLAKPRLNLLVVGSALAGYAMGGGETSQVSQTVATILGTALVAGGASAYNQVLERETDALMRRTRLRPLPDGRLQTGEALVFATALSALGLATLAAGVNTLCCDGRPRHAPQLRGDLHAAEAR